MPPKPWPLIASRKEASLRIFGLRIDRSLSPRTQEEHDFYILESLDWVNVIPITTDDRVVLIRQYRHGIQEVTLEIPGGIVEGRDSPEEAARRELMEETGYEAAQMIPLGFVHPNPAFLNNRCHTYVAKDVVKVAGQSQDEKEDIEVLLRPVKDIPGLIREGRITHSLVLAAFYRFYMEFRT
ncbi:MAG: NUDIX hydrolase [Deltaproteobacteria bacterium]|nr:NUDIX hydrolase [Deltaproteobacteria bacterium]